MLWENFVYTAADLKEDTINEFISKLPPAEIYILDRDDNDNSKLDLLRKWLPRVVLSDKVESINDFFQNLSNENKPVDKKMNSIKGIDFNKIAFAYYLNKNFESNKNQLKNPNSKNCFSYKFIAIDRDDKKLLESNDNEERVLSSFIEFLKNDKNTSIDKLCNSDFVLFKNHYETNDNANDFIKSLPQNCCFLEGISGGNYTNSLIRNSVFNFKHFVKIIESCLTNITIIDERLYEKYKNPEISNFDTPCDLIILTLEGFKIFLQSNQPVNYTYEDVCSKLLDYAKYLRVNLRSKENSLTESEKNQFNCELDFFENNEEIFKDFLTNYFEVEKNNFIIKSWGSYFAGKNINIYDIDIENSDKMNIVFNSVINNERSFDQAIKKLSFYNNSLWNY